MLSNPPHVAALVALSEANIPTDVQELLVAGDADRGIAPGALQCAVRAVLVQAVQAINQHDRIGREWAPGSFFDAVTREASTRVMALAAATNEPKDAGHE